MSQHEIISNTKVKVQMAVLDLLKENSIEEITVKQIAEKAYISRVHFYNYFLDKYDVLETLEKEFLCTFKEILIENKMCLKETNDLLDDDLYQLLYQNTIKNMNYFLDNKKLLLCMVGKNGDANFIERIHKIYKIHFEKTLPTVIVIKNRQRYIDNVILFITKGISSICENWIRNSFDDSVEDISKNMIDLIIASLQVMYKGNS